MNLINPRLWRRVNARDKLACLVRYTTTFRDLHGLTVDHAGRWADLARYHQQLVIDALPYGVVPPGAEYCCTVERGGKFRGSMRHGQPARSRHKMALTTSRGSVVRGRPRTRADGT